nr:eukaryotic peptide chain release factor GTP-binding subunit-like [Nicotiana tomentosiformis]
MFTESQTKKVNVVEDVQPMSNEEYEEANYVNNPQGGYQRQPYQGSGQQHQWRSNPQGQGNQQWRNDQGSSNQGNWSNNNNNFSNQSSNPYVPRNGQYSNSPHWNESSSSEFKLENMLERVLQNQERSDTSKKNMTELVGSHTASIQKLEMQMRDFSRDQNPKQKVRTQEVNHEEVKEKVIEATKILTPIPRPPPHFPQRLARKVDDSKLEKFYDILKKLSVNIPFVEAFQEMPGFAKYLKDLITKNKTTKNEVVNVTHRVSSIIATTSVQKKEDPGAFTILFTIGLRDFA